MLRRGYLIVAIAASAMLFWALADHAYGFYILLRWIVCGVSFYGACIFIGRGRLGWIVTLVIIAFLFNPVIPIHLTRSAWAPINIATGLALLASGLNMLARGSAPDKEMT
jgi:hypothetical protein